MESLNKIAVNLPSQTEAESTTSTTEQERRRVLAKVLFDDRIARQFDPRPAEETDRIVTSMLPVTRSIPTRYLYECYVVAMEMRAAGNNFPITGIELVQAWKEKQGAVEMESLRADRLLPANAAAACVRCYKRTTDKGIVECLEINAADGSLMGPCDHRPLTAEEQADAARKRVDFLANMRAHARRTEEARRKADGEARAKADAEKPKGKRLQCTSCQRTVSSLAGWTGGEPCNVQLAATCPKCGSAGVQSLGKLVCRECFHSYEPLICDGRMYAEESDHTRYAM